jgi:hypothetical protein
VLATEKAVLVRENETLFGRTKVKLEMKKKCYLLLNFLDLYCDFQVLEDRVGFLEGELTKFRQFFSSNVQHLDANIFGSFSSSSDSTMTFSSSSDSAAA